MHIYGKGVGSHFFSVANNHDFREKQLSPVQ